VLPLIQHNGFLFAFFVSWEFSDTGHKIKINGLKASALFNENGAIRYLLDNPVKLMAVEGIEQAFLSDKSFCKRFHIGASFFFSFFNDAFKYGDLPLLAKQNEYDKPQEQDGYKDRRVQAVSSLKNGDLRVADARGVKSTPGARCARRSAHGARCSALGADVAQNSSRFLTRGVKRCRALGASCGCSAWFLTRSRWFLKRLLDFKQAFGFLFKGSLAFLGL
jgi:hypothetical protein